MRPYGLSGSGPCSTYAPIVSLIGAETPEVRLSGAGQSLMKLVEFPRPQSGLPVDDLRGAVGIEGPSNGGSRLIQ